MRFSWRRRDQKGLFSLDLRRFTQVVGKFSQADLAVRRTPRKSVNYHLAMDLLECLRPEDLGAHLLAWPPLSGDDRSAELNAKQAREAPNLLFAENLTTLAVNLQKLPAKF